MVLAVQGKLHVLSALGGFMIHLDIWSFWICLDFYIFRLLLKVTKLTTEHKYGLKWAKNIIKSP